MIANWLRALNRRLPFAGRRSSKATQSQRLPYRLQWELLEDRVAPAVTANLNAGLLTVTLGAASDTATLTGLIAAGTTIGVTGSSYGGPASFTGVTAITVTGT